MRLDHITSSNFGYVATIATTTTPLHLTKTSRLNLDRQPRYVQPSRNTERESVRVLPAKNRQRCEPSNRLPGDHSVVEPPDPIPNSEVKRNRADGSVAQAMQE